eukprot:2131226-Amphidinium_carterae.1
MDQDHHGHTGADAGQHEQHGWRASHGCHAVSWIQHKEWLVSTANKPWHGHGCEFGRATAGARLSDVHCKSEQGRPRLDGERGE